MYIRFPKRLFLFLFLLLFSISALACDAYADVENDSIFIAVDSHWDIAADAPLAAAAFSVMNDFRHIFKNTCFDQLSEKAVFLDGFSLALPIEAESFSITLQAAEKAYPQNISYAIAGFVLDGIISWHMCHVDQSGSYTTITLPPENIQNIQQCEEFFVALFTVTE